MRLKSTPIEQLTFQGGEETLAHRVVITIANRAHRDTNLSLMTPMAKGHRGVLRALVRVMNHPMRATLAARHMKGVEHELDTHVIRHRPAHHAAAKHIEHHRHIEKPGERGDIRNVCNPRPIGRHGREVSIDQV